MNKTFLLMLLLTLSLEGCITRKMQCIHKRDLKKEQFLVPVYGKKESPFKYNAYIQNKGECVGLYFLYYKMGTGQLVVPVLKNRHGYIVFTKDVDSSVNNKVLEEFRQSFKPFFTETELNKIEERFLKGTLFVGQI